MSEAYLEQRWLKAAYKELHTQIRDILYRHDPIGINLGAETADEYAPTDEYEPEAGMILARRTEVRSVEDLRRIIHEVFVSQFDLDPASGEEWFHPVALDIWPEWTEHFR